MVNRTQGPASATATTRRPWDTSTRLPAGRSRRNAGDAEKGTNHAHGDENESAEAGKRSHSRCTSPKCQSRRSAAAAAVSGTTPLPVTSRRDAPICSEGSKGRQQNPERVGQTKKHEVTLSENPTRAMIERAFDAAFTSTLQDPGLTALDASVDGSVSASEQRQHPSPRRDVLVDTDDAAKQWRAHYARRREQRQRAAEEQLARDSKAAEFQRMMLAARVEYQQRKLAIQSLQARLQREMQFLESTAAELSHRESLLDEAFEGYEQWLRGQQDNDASGSNARAG